MNKQTLPKLFQKIQHERRGGAPSGDWVSRNRDILMMQVKNSVEAKQSFKPLLAVSQFFSIFVPTKAFMLVGQVAMVFLILLGVVSGGGFAIAAITSEALPGSALYQMKLAIETAQIKLAPSSEYKFKIVIESADRRADEISRLADGNVTNAKYVPQAVESFKQNIITMTSSLDVIKTSNPKYAIEAAKLLERKTSTYKDNLNKALDLLPSTYTANIASIQDVIDDSNGKAVALIVEKYLAGDDKATKSIVETKLTSRVENAEQKVLSVTIQNSSDTTVAKQKLTEVRELLKEEKYQAALSKIEEVFVITKQVELSEAAAKGGNEVLLVTPPDAPAPKLELPSASLNINSSESTNTNATNLNPSQ